MERVVKSSGEPKSQSYDVVEASRNSGEAMSQSCEVTMLRSSQTGPMSTQLQCTENLEENKYRKLEKFWPNLSVSPEIHIFF